MMGSPDNQVSPAVSIEDGVLRLRISTVAGGNSMDFDAITHSLDALRTIDSTVGSILLLGGGANFCAGGNVKDFAAADDRSAFVRTAADSLHEFVLALDAATVPIVAGINGWAAGAGMSMVLHVDVAIGGRSTKLRPAYPSLGFSPDGGMSWTLPRIVGPSRARDILLSDSVIGGEEAHRLGILARLVGDDVIGAEAERIARWFAAGPSATFAATKQLLRSSESHTLAEHLGAEAESIAALAGSPTGREGVDAFVAKRRPDFTR